MTLLNQTQSLEVLRGVTNDHNRCLAGIVSSRTCPLCGHHEVGLAAADGGFYPLKPGMAIRIVAPLPEDVDSLKTAPVRQALPQEEVEEYTPWVPDPVMSYRALRLKYGVKVRADRIGKTMSPEIYRAAYLDKLRELIVREVYVPLPVILDRFFTAPHLATGNPGQIAEAMWRELKEVREPARRVEEWLETREPSILTGEIPAKEGIAGECPSKESVLKELDELSLEVFLGML